MQLKIQRLMKIVELCMRLFHSCGIRELIFQSRSSQRTWRSWHLRTQGTSSFSLASFHGRAPTTTRLTSPSGRTRSMSRGTPTRGCLPLHYLLRTSTVRSFRFRYPSSKSSSAASPPLAIHRSPKPH